MDAAIAFIESENAISWNDVRQPHVPRTVRYSSLPPGLAHAVTRLEVAIGRHSGSTKRAAPSAGACYPYDVLIAPIGSNVLGFVDLDRRRVVTKHSDRDLWNGKAFEYYLVGHPWLSVRKYGRRGYLYHLLDAGHAILNLSLTACDPAAGQHGRNSALAQRLARDSFVRGGLLLAIGVLEVEQPATHAQHWVMQETADAAVLPPVGDIERMLCPLLPPPGEPLFLDFMADACCAELASEIAGRHSAAFLDDVVSADRVEWAVERCFQLCNRLIPAFGIPVPGMRVFSRVSELGAAVPDSEWIERALIGQTHLANASTFIVIHYKIRDVARAALSAHTQMLMIGSGIAGEIVYLVAARAGLGVTGVGGIDPGLWAHLCGTQEEVMYLLAIGSEKDGEKFDITTRDGHHV